MRAHELLLEYDRSRTLNTLTDEKIFDRLTPMDWRTLYAHWEGADISARLHETPAQVFQTYCQKAVKGALRVNMNDEDGAPIFTGRQSEYWGYWKWVKEFIMDLCEQADPSSKNKFTPFVLRWWYKGRGISYLEDIYKAKEALETYIKFKNRIRGLDLSKISFSQFADKMDEVAAVPSGSEEDKAMMQGFFERGDAYLTLDNERVRVVVPHTVEAAQYFGRNTRWCTSARENNQFASYNRRGSLFIVLFKSTNTRWQWHFDDQMFCDEKDEPNNLSVKLTLPEYPELMELWDNNQSVLIQKYVELGQGHIARDIIKKMFNPSLDDFKLLLRGKDDSKVLKGDTWNLQSPLSRKDVVDVAQELWRKAHGHDK